MARSDLLVSLVQAGAIGDKRSFRTTAEAIIAEEKAKRHDVPADRLSKAIQPNGNGMHGLPLGMGTTELWHLMLLLWFFNFSNVLLGAQTFAGWLGSSTFIAATVLGARMLLGNSLASLPAIGGSSTVAENP